MAKMTFVSPIETATNAISIIESNSGVIDFVKDIIELPDKDELIANLQSEGLALINSISAKQKARAEALFQYAKLTNTKLSSIIDLTAIDLSSLFDFDSLNLEDLGISSLQEIDWSSLIDLSSVDISSWDLPKPTLSTLDPECNFLPDMYMSNLMDLSSIDLRGFKLPSLDLSGFGGFSGIKLSSLFDLSSIDLSGIIDLTSVSIPDYLIPDDFHIDWDFDTNFEFSRLKSIFGSLGSSGDLFGMANLAKAFNGIGCIGTTIADICNPSAILDVLSNFDIPQLNLSSNGWLTTIKDSLDDLIDSDGLDNLDLSSISKKLNISGYIPMDDISSYLREFVSDLPTSNSINEYIASADVDGPILSALSYLGDKWWWYDEDLKKYDFTALANVSPTIVYAMATDTKYLHVVHAMIGFKLYAGN